MELRDLFVATVSLVLGGMMLYAAILDQGWCFQMTLARKIDETMGREKARTFIGSVGALLLLIGLYLIAAPLLAASLLQPTDIENRPSDPRIGPAFDLAEVD